MVLAPLRGVTIRAFRETFAAAIRDAGFTGAVAPFIPANPGFRGTDRVFADLLPGEEFDLPLVPQVISKDPDALRLFLEACKARGFDRADLNAGCPFPMIVRRGRGSGLFKNLDLFEHLVATGCEVMGPGKFSVKTRLGLVDADEIFKMLPRLDRYPLAHLTIHARTARQMYDGACDVARAVAVAEASANPVVYNGDVAWRDKNAMVTSRSGVTPLGSRVFAGVMVGRSFVRALGEREDAGELLADYIARSRAELSGDAPVLGRVKELVSYWTEMSRDWKRRWNAIKICRSLDELALAVR